MRFIARVVRGLLCGTVSLVSGLGRSVAVLVFLAMLALTVATVGDQSAAAGDGHEVERNLEYRT